ncbi:MAG: MFS transporter [Pseudomonadota bacterium]
MRTALILGQISAVGPAAIDVHLPAMPLIAADLVVPLFAVQGTLVAYFAGFGVAQLMYGPWSDQAGRRQPLLIGLALFAVSSVGCAIAQDVAKLTVFRTLQGVGGAAVVVLPRAVIRDLHTGPEAARLMGVVMLAVAISPMLAPLFGSLLLLVGP